MEQKTAARYITVFYTAVQALMMIAFATTREYDQIIYSSLAYAAYLFLFFFEGKRGFPIENYIRGLVIATIIGHFLLGEFLNLYYILQFNSFIFFDKLLHFVGSFAFALLSYSLLSKATGFTCSIKHGAFILIVLLGISLGTVFEIVEFLLDVIMSSKNQSGLFDTDMDMILNTIGALTAGAFVELKNT